MIIIKIKEQRKLFVVVFFTHYFRSLKFLATIPTTWLLPAVFSTLRERPQESSSLTTTQTHFNWQTKSREFVSGN